MNFFKKKSFCPRLWEEVFINENGNVFSCCNGPAILGNIYQESLETILNNETVHSFRQKSLAGRLECFDKCTLLNKQKISASRKTINANYSCLKRLKFTVGKTCNISCIMCRQNHNEKKFLNFEKFVENVNINPLSDIEIQGGEPFFIPEAKLFLEYFARKGKKVSFLTNGLLINDQWAEWTALHSNWVCVSINAATKKTHELINRGSCWEIVLKNIQRIIAARVKYNSSVKIIGHMTIVPQNFQEIPSFIKNYKHLGFDHINFGYDRSVPLFLKQKMFLKIKIRAEIKTAINQLDDDSSVDYLRLKILKLI